MVKHRVGEYSRVDGNTIIHTNTVEGYFSILKRGINGVYHHVGRKHLHRYLSEFDFRYNSREVTDGERVLAALKGFEGKPLTYRTRANQKQKALGSTAIKPNAKTCLDRRGAPEKECGRADLGMSRRAR